MANENPSRESSSRQQSSERAQTGSTASQQGAGTQRAGSQGSTSHGPGSSMQGGAGGTQGGAGQGSYEAERSGQSAYGRQGTSTWQGGRAGQSGTLQRRGSSATSPYGSDYEAGYGSGPFSIMRRISDEMDRFFENFGMGRSPWQEREEGPGTGRYAGESAPSMWSPHIEVCERNGKLLIQADLPGIKRDDINVRIEQDSIVIQGERNQEQTSNQSGYYRSERSYGSFYRTIPLPEGTNTDSAHASFRDGVLEIELDAPREPQRGRTLEIRDGGSISGSQAGSTSGAPGGSAGSMQGGHAGTASGSTYGGSAQHPASGTSGSQSSGSSSQHSASGTSGSQQASGTGTMHSGSGDPSAGAAGMGPSGSSDRGGSRQT